MAYKTPGVYVEEISKFPPSVAQVATAIPAFIGYTERAMDLDGNDLSYEPVKISGMADFELLFGGRYSPSGYSVDLDSDNQITAHTIQKYFLYDSLRSFYDNGGGSCYIVSVGSYSDEITRLNETDSANRRGLQVGLERVKKVDEPTLILYPDAVGAKADGTAPLGVSELGSLQAATLMQCAKLQDRFGIFDVLAAYEPDVATTSHVQDFRDNIGINNLKYGAAYYPWLITNYSRTIRLRDVTETTSGNSIVSEFDSTSLEGDATAAYTTYVEDSDKSDAVINAYTSNISGSESFKTSFRGQITFKTLNAGLSGLMNKLVTKIKNATSDTDAENAFKELLLLFREGIKLTETLKNSGTTLGNDLDKAIAEAEANADLITAAHNFIAFEKIGTLHSGLSDMTSEGDVEGQYASLNNTAWTADVSDDVADIPADSEFAPVATGGADLAAEAVAYLKANVDYALILETLDSIFGVAVHNEQLAEQRLLSQVPHFNNVIKYLDREMRLLPPSGAVAGIYAYVDGTRGVWKAPANVSISGIVGPAFKITHAEQGGLNVTESGKSVNAIRSFAGKGTLVWGARTLAGNDNEWRYVSVRRFYNMVEESTKKASEPFVFEPNDANTWVKVRAMIENFLVLQWRAGALQGATPPQAFFVKVGLGETMTALDILEGRMIVEIGLAVVRPAEFIILKFSHKMAES